MDDEADSIPRNKSEFVAQRLMERILAADLEPGSSFGTEADLLKIFDVSRPTLREGLRILEAQGIVALRPGPRGGIVVTRPGPDILAHDLSVYLRAHGVPFRALLKTREALEPALAAEAAANGSEEDFDAMQESIERMKLIVDQQQFVEENRVFHALIARASDNPVLEIFWSTISMLIAGKHLGIRFSQGNQRHVVAGHQEIVDALRSRDPERSARVMVEHVGDLQALVKRHYPQLLEQPTRIIARQGRRIA